MLVLGDKRVCVTNGDMRGVGGVQTSLMLLDGDNVYARCEEGARGAARTRKCDDSLTGEGQFMSSASI
jgi:hypothetical protein